MISLTALGALAFVGWTAVASILCALVWPRLRARAAQLEPAARARALLAIASAPAALGLAVTALCFLPGVLGVSPDHCLAHETGHPHLCAAHPPAGLGAVGAALLAGAIGAVVTAGVIALARRIAGAAKIRLLARTAVPDAERGFDLVESRLPFAFATGGLRPRVLVSTDLVASLAEPQIEAVLAHERAHASRRDGLGRSMAEMFAMAHVPGVRGAIVDAHGLACELACDEEAARVVGDRWVVADAVLAVERRLGEVGPGSAIALSFTGGRVSARVEALAAAPVTARGRLGLVVLGLVALLAAASPLLHDLTEHALRPFAR